MGDKRLRGDIESLKGKSKATQLYAVVGVDQQVHIEERAQSLPVCEHEYSRSVIGPDGVARVMLPGGKVVEFTRGCPMCRKAPR